MGDGFEKKEKHCLQKKRSWKYEFHCLTDSLFCKKGIEHALPGGMLKISDPEGGPAGSGKAGTGGVGI